MYYRYMYLNCHSFYIQSYSSGYKDMWNFPALACQIVKSFNLIKINVAFNFCFLRYGLARNMNRKIIFHAGPTNSGKTYHALQRFKAAGSGIYCGPLRLLAMEVYDKCMKDVSSEVLVSLIFNKETYLTYKSIFHKALNLF